MPYYRRRGSRRPFRMQRRGWRKFNGRGRRKGYRNPASSWYKRSKLKRYNLSRRAASQGYVKQQRTLKRSKTYTKASRGYSSSTGKTVQIVSKELVGYISQPGMAADGEATRAALCPQKGISVNVVNMGSTHHYVTPPDCTGIRDANFTALSSVMTGRSIKSYPLTEDGQVPYFYFDCGDPSGRLTQGVNEFVDGVIMQPASLYVLFSPQSGQLFRLADYAQDYDKYRILAVKVHWVPTCPTTAPGIIVMYVESNPTICPTIEKEKMMMNKTSITSSIYVPQTMTYVNPDKQWKWCVSPTNSAVYSHGNRQPDRLSDSFAVYIRYFAGEQAANIANLANMGYIYVEYIAEFATQTNNSADVADPMATAPFDGLMGQPAV